MKTTLTAIFWFIARVVAVAVVKYRSPGTRG